MFKLALSLGYKLAKNLHSSISITMTHIQATIQVNKKSLTFKLVILRADISSTL